jgi:hypothetical protein
MDKPIVTTEALTPDEEVDFLIALAEAELAGDLTHEEAHELIDREYALQRGGAA